MSIRTYEPEKDRNAVRRIWNEVGWLTDDKEEHLNALDQFLEGGRSLVAEMCGEAECLAVSNSGTLNYLKEELPFSAVVGVTTSRVARKQGLAGRLTAELVAADVSDGVVLSGLGIFDQGFYDKLGYGTGCYDHRVSFDPSQLKTVHPVRPPRRLTLEDADIMHTARLRRRRSHGAVNLTPREATSADMNWEKNGFGLGYFDGPAGELTHLFWCSAEDVESGPYDVRWMAYQNDDQFLELMALLGAMSDQVRSVCLVEPAGIQLQDLLDRPFQHRQLTHKSRYESGIGARASWQVRICSLPGCLERTNLVGNQVRFNLQLDDPIVGYLEEDAPWRGVSGNYVVTLGPSSGAEAGTDDTLPTMKATVNAFTRMWLSVRPATGLAVTDSLSAPPELLAQLDELLCLPPPLPDWEY